MEKSLSELLRELTRDEVLVQLGGFGCIDCSKPGIVANELHKLAKAGKSRLQQKTMVAESKKK